MARTKKDGRHINYYIERSIYDRLKKYADSKGQIMTTAIERIITEYLDHCDGSAFAATQEQYSYPDEGLDGRKT